MENLLYRRGNVDSKSFIFNFFNKDFYTIVRLVVILCHFRDKCARCSRRHTYVTMRRMLCENDALSALLEFLDA